MSRAEILGGIGMVLFAGLVIVLVVLKVYWLLKIAAISIGVVVGIAFFFWAGMVLVHDWQHRDEDLY